MTNSERIPVGAANAAGDDQDSDSAFSLNYGSGSEGEGPLDAGSYAPTAESTYASVEYFETEEETETALRQLNELVYSYKTRYLSTLCVGKEYICCSHAGCCHNNKPITHRASELLLRFDCQCETKGYFPDSKT